MSINLNLKVLVIFFINIMVYKMMSLFVIECGYMRIVYRVIDWFVVIVFCCDLKNGENICMWNMNVK